MRADVDRFAHWMAEAMDSKHIERESRDQPHYMAKEYPLSDALACLQDKTEQLVYATNRPEDYERVRKTAVHLANFCMIIARKVEAIPSTLEETA